MARVIRGTWNCVQTSSTSEDSGTCEAEISFFKSLFKGELAIAFGILAHAEKAGLLGKALIDKLLNRLITAGFDG
jgi:hypothetical protein